MLYLIAFLVPPLAVLLSGKPFQAILNLVIWLLTAVAIFPILIAMFHAFWVVHNHYADQRQRRLIREMAEVQARSQGVAEGLRSRRTR